MSVAFSFARVERTLLSAAFDLDIGERYRRNPIGVFSWWTVEYRRIASIFAWNSFE